MTTLEQVRLWLAREARHPWWVAALFRRPSVRMERSGDCEALACIEAARQTMIALVRRHGGAACGRGVAR